MQPNILVIGSSGQVASCLKDICDNDQLFGNYLFFGRPAFDICNQKQLLEIVTEYKPKLIINCAAYTNVDQAEDEPELAYAVNSEAVRNLVLVCGRFDVKLIHLSTDYVFDGSKEGAYNESDAPNPLSIYGKSKLAGEEHIRANLAEHIIIRTSWIFSPYGHNFFKNILRLASEKDELKIINDQKGGPTSAHHIAQMLKNIAEKILDNEQISYGTYHYCDFPAVSWYEFARKIIELSAIKKPKKWPNILPITTSEYKTKAVRPQNSVLDCALLDERFGIKQNLWLDALIRYIHE